MSDFIIKGSYESLNEASSNIILGELLARKLDLDIGNRVSLMLPDNKLMVKKCALSKVKI